MNAGRYCTATFLDVSQTFDKVWHAGLLHKIKSCFPPDLYAIIKSYLLQRTFRFKFGEMLTQLKDINSEIPQGSMLGLMLYLLYTAELPVVQDTIIATYANNTVILMAHKDYVEASQRLQKSLFHIQIWLKKWRIRVNRAKSIQVTFTTRRKTTSNLERCEYPSSREREIFGTTSRSQTKLEKTHPSSENNLESN